MSCYHDTGARVLVCELELYLCRCVVVVVTSGCHKADTVNVVSQAKTTLSDPLTDTVYKTDVKQRTNIHR